MTDTHSDGVTLRLVAARDLLPIQSLDEEVFGDLAYSITYLKTMYLLFRTTWYVAECDGELAGYALVCPNSGNTEVWLTGLAVGARYQGLGIGRRLMDKAMELMVQSSALKGFITVRPGNTAARHLYQKFGFTPQGEVEEDFYGNGEPRQVLHRSLVKHPHDPDR